MEINLGTISLGGLLHLHFSGGREHKGRGRECDEVLEFRQPSLFYSEDPADLRKQEMSDEHDGTPVYVANVPRYLIGGAVLEQGIHIESLGLVRGRCEVFHRKGQVYRKLVSLDQRVSFPNVHAITDAVRESLRDRIKRSDPTRPAVPMPQISAAPNEEAKQQEIHNIIQHRYFLEQPDGTRVEVGPDHPTVRLINEASASRERKK
jgi:hypothetical protein